MQDDKSADITVEDGKLSVPHLGLTLRSIMGAAIKNRDKLESLTTHRCVYPIYYKQVQVCTIKLGKDFQAV